jgi:hypothetical protein
MYCINYGSFDYGQGRSGRLSHSETPSKYAKEQQWSSLVRTQSLLSPVESSLMFALPPSPLKRLTRLSLLPSS